VRGSPHSIHPRALGAWWGFYPMQCKLMHIQVPPSPMSAPRRMQNVHEQIKDDYSFRVVCNPSGPPACPRAPPPPTLLCYLPLPLSASFTPYTLIIPHGVLFRASPSNHSFRWYRWLHTNTLQPITRTVAMPLLQPPDRYACLHSPAHAYTDRVYGSACSNGVCGCMSAGVAIQSPLSGSRSGHLGSSRASCS
jgi:hypothetical protein